MDKKDIEEHAERDIEGSIESHIEDFKDNKTKYIAFKDIRDNIEKKNKEKIIYIDVRSPKEFEADHIPGSINIPILDDDERAIVGILYKNSGQKDAIVKGVELFQNKFSKIYSNLSLIINQMDDGSDKKLNVCVYCFRGGMRSNSMCFLVNSLSSMFNNGNINVFAVEKGYKGYREYIKKNIDTIKIKPRFIVLHGLTGTGKTDILIEMKNRGEPVIELEGLAKHRSSLFGGVGLSPNSQKMFESRLLGELEKLNDEKYVFIEGESRRIGDIILNDNVFSKMQKGINIMIESDMEIRKKRIVYEYTKHKPESKVKTIDNSELLKITEKIKKISNKEKEEIIDAIKDNDLEKASGCLIDYYYDPLYKYTIDTNEYLKRVNSDSVDSAVEELISIRKKLLSK